MGSVKTDHCVNVQADLSDLVFHSSRLEETPDKCTFVHLQTWVLINFCCLTPEKHMFNEYVIFNAYPQHMFSLRNEETFNTYMINVLKFRTPRCLTKWHMQTVQTQIRLLHMQTVQTQIRLLQREQSDQGIHYLPFH